MYGASLLLRWMPSLVALLLLTPVSRAESLDARAVHDLIERTLEYWHVPGVAVAIVRGEDLIYLKGHRLRSVGSEEKVTPDTLFPIASCTKSFTTAAMALLVDEGKMNWDDRPRKYVPYFRLSDPLADAEVTLRDLVTHRTGLRGHDMLWYRSPWTQEDIIRRVGRLPLDKPFRAAFQYQSTMFTAAGFAVASASGMSWADFVRKRLLKPLDMKKVYFTTKEIADIADKASPHRLDEKGQPKPIEPYPMDVPEPAGSIHASAAELSKWLRFQLNNKSVHGKPLVSERNLETMHTPQIVIPMDAVDRTTFPGTHQMSYGMGWVIQDHFGHRLLQHAGAIDGFRCHFTLVPKERLGIVLLCNLDQTRMNLALSNALLDVLLGLRPRNWNKIVGEAEREDQEQGEKKQREDQKRQHVNTHPSRELSAYTGNFEHPAYGTASITFEEGALVWHWNRFTAPLKHFHYDTFTLPILKMGEPHVVFTLDERGAVARMKVKGEMDVEFKRSR